MRLLLVNYRYFVSGGPERYLFNITKELERSGSTVVPFSVRNKHNENSPFDRYFLSPLGKGDQIYYDDLKPSLRTYLKLIDRAVYSWEAKFKMRKLIQSEAPDAAYLLHFLRWISPSIVPVIKASGVPIVVRVSDYSYVCPGTHLLRDGRICDLCLGGNLLHSVKYRCVHGSAVLSTVNMLSLYSYRAMGIWSDVDRFICPSQFSRRKMIEGGFPSSKVLHIPTFVDSSRFRPIPDPGKYILYFGRFSVEKGLDTLIKAFEILKGKSGYPSLRMLIVGRHRSDDLENFRAFMSPRVAADVDFLPEKGVSELAPLIANSLCTVVPSRCYENLPNSVLESFACGKPVIASNLGSLPEVVRHEETGLLFEPNNPDDLALQLSRLLSNKTYTETLGRNALKLTQDYYSPQRHLEALLEVFSSCRHQ